ncbi:DUF4336 domain-containing protein [Archangium violaceum]|uniref:DUF4336 domain-containing protein n=1 Tax=Archangium violaceum TaxID=83451 RepID=UPI001950E7A1|nr:DUF4336 domain-containing protein [Archangium violaceum]QRN98647.1 DUF4336 domain-containing protein [Archangium violaceum]
MLRPLSNDLFVLDVPFRMKGFDLGGRMTVVRLPDGGLWLHSPVKLDAAVRQAVDAVGPVRFLVAPNIMHHLSLGDWAAAYPSARVLAPAGLRAKRKDLRIDVELSDVMDVGQSPTLELLLAHGVPKLEEFAFLHRPSRTLLLTDLAFNIHDSSSWLTRNYLKLCGAYGRLAPTWLLKTMVKDKAALRAWRDRVLSWDFDRVVPCHGQVLERGGKEAMRDAFAWL